VSAATQVIEAGILDGVSAVLGLHVWPDLPVGQVGFRLGAAMAGSGWFRIRLHGRSVHAAQPHRGVDSITAVANLINLLQLVVTRNVDPGVPVLLNVGTIQGGYRRNVVADMVEITGTVRALDQDLLDRLLPTRIERALQGLCQAVDATYTFDYYPEVPVLQNSAALAEVVRARLMEGGGTAHPVVLHDIALTGEDFAFYTKRVPGLFMFLGCSDPAAGERVPLHSPRFDLDERAIGVGVRAIVTAALAVLESAGDDSGQGTDAHGTAELDQPSAL
jgi:amidohydrolase